MSRKYSVLGSAIWGIACVVTFSYCGKNNAKVTDLSATIPNFAITSPTVSSTAVTRADLIGVRPGKPGLRYFQYFF